MSIDVTGIIKEPKLIRDDYIDFGTVQIKDRITKRLTIINPSDEVIVIQFFIGPKKLSNIHYDIESEFKYK
jgi:hypothetical protein